MSYEGARFVSGILDSAQLDHWHSDPARTYLRRGLIVGKSAGNSRWYVCRGEELSADEAAGQTTLSVALTPWTEGSAGTADTGANVFIRSADGTSGPQDLGAIVSRVASTSVTITTGLIIAYVTGDYLYVSPAAADGRHIACGILADDVDMLDPNDPSSTVHQQVSICVAGMVDSTKLLNPMNKFLAELRDSGAGNQGHSFFFGA